LGVVRKYIEGKPLEGAHNGLVDAKAQTNIVLHKDFIDYIDKTKSIHTIDSIIIKKQHSPMVECRAVSHLLVYIITYKKLF